MTKGEKSQLKLGGLAQFFLFLFYLEKRRNFKASLSKLDCPVWQTGVFSFGRKI
jgi:hypothetical protein